MPSFSRSRTGKPDAMLLVGWLSAKQKGLLVVHTGRESIKLGPPLTITDDALLEGVLALGEAIAEIAEND